MLNFMTNTKSRIDTKNNTKTMTTQMHQRLHSCAPPAHLEDPAPVKVFFSTNHSALILIF